jgi:preprotein translocase subunit SecA
MMATDNLSDVVSNIREDVVNDIVSEYIPHGSLDEQWDLEGLQEALHNEFGVDMPVVHWMEEDADLNENGLRDKILQILVEDYEAKEQVVGADGMRQYEKYILLQVLDKLWKEHLAAMDYLRQSIGLRGYAQKNPKQEYKRESFNMFTEMLDRIKHEAVTLLSKVQIRAREEVEDLEHQGHQQPENVSYQHQQAGAMQDTAQAEDAAAASEQHKPYVRGERKLGRNEPCWCGSGKKFKHCHGKLV